jgi:hypothetical protein
MAREEEHGKTKVATPRPSFAGKACNEADGRRGRGDENPIHELPNEEERKSTRSPKRSARSFYEKKCRGEANKRTRFSSAGEDSSARNSAMNPPAYENPRNGPIIDFVERIWTDVHAEIRFLNSIIDYHKIKGEYPFHNLAALYNFTKNWLRVDVPDYERLINVVRKLRRKYLMTRARRGPNGAFADPRVQRAFNLASILWGDGSDKRYWLSLYYITLQWDDTSGTTISG